MRQLTRVSIQTRYQRRASRTLLMITIVLVVTYFPMICLFTYAIYWEYNGDHNEVRAIKPILIVSNWSRIAIFSNASINALICIWRNEEIRKLYRNIFYRRFKWIVKVKERI